MLTDTAIKRLKPQAKPYRMTDGKGLYLWLTPAGGKLWRYKYRHAGLNKMMTFGAYPEVSLADARERHTAARKLLAAGVDPMAQRKAEKAAESNTDALSFHSIADLWHSEWKANKSAQHIGATYSRLEANVYPSLGGRPVAEIEAPDIVRMVKTIEARGVGDVAKRAMQTVGQIFRFAIAHGYAKRNPVADIKPGDVLKPLTTVNQARIDAKHLPALLKAIEVYQGKVVTRLAIKLMLLTFPRTTELIGGRWSEINWEAKRWDIPGERMKMKTAHIIPLSKQALEVLELLRTVSGSGELMFPGDVDPTQTMSNNTILFALYRIGYKGDMTGHGFRGLAATILNENDFEEEHVDLQLAHMKRNKVSAAYNHAKYLKQRTVMMQWWGDYVEAALRSKPV